MAGILEFHFLFDNADLQIGLSGFSNSSIETFYFDSLGMEAVLEEEGEEEEEEGEEETEMVDFSEVGMTPYIKLDHEKFQVLVEYHNVTHTASDDNEEAIPDFNYQALSAQLMFKATLSKRPFYPYIRYDYSDLPDNGGYYFGLENEPGSETISRVFRQSESILMVGAAWDVADRFRLKLEYANTIDGATKMHAVTFSTAFSF